MIDSRATPVILDTDIGTDPDDLLALLMVAGSPELELVAVTTTYGDTRLRARIAAQTCRWISLDPIIAVGPSAPISKREIWYAGNEANQIDEPLVEQEDLPDAVETILDLATRHAGRLMIIAIGPLTNVAHAVQRDPTLPQKIDTISIMGGDFANRGATEHNFACDSEAARIVMEAGFKTRVIGVEQTRRLALQPEETGRWTNGPASPLRRRLASDLGWWRTFHQTDDILVHDPLAVAMVTHAHLFRFVSRGETVHVDGDWAGRVVAASDTSIDVVDDFACADLRDVVVNRILTSLERGDRPRDARS